MLHNFPILPLLPSYLHEAKGYFFYRQLQTMGCMLTSLSSCRRSLSKLAGQAPAWWWWNCLERLFSPFSPPPSLSHNNIGNKWVEKQNKRSRTHPSRVAFSLFFPPFNSALQIFQREHRQSRDYKPLSLSLVDMPAHRGGLHILHILNRSRIFHGLG